MIPSAPSPTGSIAASSTTARSSPSLTRQSPTTSSLSTSLAIRCGRRTSTPFSALAVRGRVRDPIHQNTASANMSTYGLPERLQQVEFVLHQKNIPTAEWENETFIGRG